MFMQTFDLPDPTPLVQNIGAGLDIPSGFFQEGRHGEMILVGGVGGETGVIGRPNRFKTTVSEFMQLTPLERMLETLGEEFIFKNTHDTESTTYDAGKERLLTRFPNLSAARIIEKNRWQITSQKTYSGNKWFEKVKEFCDQKTEHKKKLMVDTPFWNREKTGPMRVICPSYLLLDSISRFQPDSVTDLQDSKEVDSSEQNRIHMIAGQAKQRLLMAVPHVMGSVNHHIIITVWVDDKIQMAQRPGAAPPAKKLLALKGDDSVKGVPGDFFFTTNITWQTLHAKEKQTDKQECEYPRIAGTSFAGDNDLMEVQFYCVRSKSGKSKYTIPILVSQSEGVLASLTEFNIIKESQRYGLEGTLQSYGPVLYPDCKFSRTTVRSKLDADPKLCRAVNILCELFQMQYFMPQYSELYCTPQMLFDDLKKMGYDWDMILGGTRGWWTFNDEKHPLKFLSTLDLLRIRAGLYKPYWMQ